MEVRSEVSKPWPCAISPERTTESQGPEGALHLPQGLPLPPGSWLAVGPEHRRHGLLAFAGWFVSQGEPPARAAVSLTNPSRIDRVQSEKHRRKLLGVA